MSKSAQADADILNERGPVGLTHPLPAGYATIETPFGKWCVVSQTDWVSDVGWEGDTESEAIESFKHLNPNLCVDVPDPQNNEASFEMTP